MALRDNLVSWWELNETSGTRYDAHGTNHLTDNNTVLYGTGKQGNCADFEDTNSEYLSITNAAQTGLSPTGDFSVSAWFKAESQPASGYEFAIVSKTAGGAGGSYMFTYLNSSGTYKLYAALYDSSAPGTNVNYFSAAQTLSNGTWYHLAFVVTAASGKVEFFVNGSSIGSVTDASMNDINTCTAPFNIGAFNSSNRFMDGILDEVGFWSRALTSTEVTSLYNSGNGLSYADTAGGGAVNSGFFAFM